MTDPDSLSRIREICKQPCGHRLSTDIAYLVSLTKSMKVFQDLISKQGPHYHSFCCQYLLYESFRTNDYVFKQGDIGTKYYILISGQVSIEIISNESGHRTTTEIMTFSSGSSFGELALENSKPRSASAICKTTCHLLVLSKLDYSRLMQRIVADKKHEMTEFLHSLPMFFNINRLLLAKLTYNITEKTFKRGQFLCREGDCPKEIFIVYKGECKLCKSVKKNISNFVGKNISRQKMHTAKLLGRGAMIGEDDIFKKNRYSYSCVCCSDEILVYSISERDFFSRITSEHTLQYLRESSEEKFRFLQSWSSVRGSLDNIFAKKPSRVSSLTLLPTTDSITRLNSVVSYRKKLLQKDLKKCSSRNSISEKETPKSAYLATMKSKISPNFSEFSNFATLNLGKNNSLKPTFMRKKVIHNKKLSY